MKTFVFLDLEGVVIPSWDKRHEILWQNLDKIKMVTDTLDNVCLGLMSWAVHDDKDKKIFDDELKECVERRLGVKFTNVWSMDEWVELSNRDNKRQLYNAGKFATLQACKNMFDGNPVYLFDDMVDNVVVQNFHLVNYFNSGW